jgi:hypothetical protein
MSDEQKVDEGAEEKQSGGMIFKIAIVAVLLVVPLVLALITWKVLGPQLADGGDGGGDTAPPVLSMSNAVTVPFNDEIASLIPSDPEFPAAILMYSVGLECANQETANLVNSHLDRFLSIVTQKHRHLNRDQAEDNFLIDSIDKQILIEANDMLRRYQLEPSDEIRIIEVFHSKWAVRD